MRNCNVLTVSVEGFWFQTVWKDPGILRKDSGLRSHGEKISQK